MNIADTLQHYIYVPTNDNGNKYLQSEEVLFREEDFVEHQISPVEFEAAWPLVEAINKACGSDIDLGEEDILSPEQVGMALKTIRGFRNPPGGLAFVSVRDRIAGILEQAASLGYSVWFDF